MNRWLKLTVIIVFFCILLSGCDDDFAPYTNIDYDVSIHLKSNIFVISEAKQELSRIVDEYAKDMPLTYVHYEIYNTTKGTVEFQFFGGYENGENRATCITLYVDINTNNITKINYEDGHGKRMSSIGSHEIKQTANINTMDVYNSEIMDRFLESDEYVSISVTDADIFSRILTGGNSDSKAKNEESIGKGLASVMSDDMNQALYRVEIVSDTKNKSYIEYPRVSGIEEKKQNAVNKILEDQVLYGAKDYRHNALVDFSDLNYHYIYKTRIGFANKDIASFVYTFSRYAEKKLADDFQGHISRKYGVTIDMKTGKKIDLWDFMEIDERLINSNDGSNIKTDYASAKLPEFHNFKDAFEVYSSEEDSYHNRSVEETIEYLKDKRGETNWYIDDNKNIVFYYSKNRVKIPYNRISDVIYPKYLDVLNE